MGKPDFSITVRLTPRQAIGIVVVLRERQTIHEHSTRWRSAYSGAEYRVRNALLDEGWTEDPDKNEWVRSE